MSKGRLLFVGNTSWSMWNFRREVMLHLKEQGYEVIVVSPEDGFVDQLREHFTFEKLRYLARKDKNPMTDVLLIMELYKIYKKYQPDHIFQYTIKPNIYGSIAAFLCRIRPHCVIVGMGHVFTRFNALTVFVIFLYRIATSAAKKVMFLNPEDAIDFKRLWMIPKKSKKVFILPSEGVDPDFFCPQNPLEEMQGASNQRLKETKPLNFLFVGRLLRDKGIIEYCKVAQKLKAKYHHVNFQILGAFDFENPSGISKEELFSYTEKKVVDYLGAAVDVRFYLAKADAIVHPTTYGEGFSRVCLEALSMSIPVITTDNRGCKELVVDQITGLVYPWNKQDQLIDKIEEFIHLAPERRRQLGANGREKVKTHFTIHHVQKQYELILNESAV